MDLKSSDKVSDMKLITEKALRELHTIGEFIGGAEYRAAYYQEKTGADELHEWVSMLSYIERILDEAIGVANE